MATNQEPFQIKNMHNLHWTNKDGSPSICKASFTLVFLPQKAELKDCLYKVGKNGPWVESKSIQCDEWTDRNGNKHTWTQICNLKTMGKLLEQLEKFLTGIYHEDDDDYSLVNGTANADKTTTAATTEATTTEAEVAAA